MVLGSAGFFFVLLLDWLSLKNNAVLKRLCGLLSAGLVLYATVMVCLAPDKYELPFFVLPPGIALAVVSFLLLIYSLFLEIPFHSTYAKKGVGDMLITTGTYALTRHPGVLWMGFFYIGLSIIFPSVIMFVAVAVWLIMDISLVVLEDRFLFPRMFPGYDDYKKKTPFLIPTRQSLSNCRRTLRPGR